MSKDEKPDKSDKKKSGGGILKLILVVIPLMSGLVHFIPAFLIAIVGMIPTFFAYISDRNHDRSLTACVGAFNFLGVVVFVVQKTMQGASIQDVLKTLTDPITILTIFAACGVGWLFYSIVPPIVASALIASAKGDIKSLEQRQTALKAEWGDNVSE